MEGEEDYGGVGDQSDQSRWHEIGNGPPPISASKVSRRCVISSLLSSPNLAPACINRSDFTVMVEQISAILSARLRDLLIWRMMWGGSSDPSNSFTRLSSSNTISNNNNNNNKQQQQQQFQQQQQQQQQFLAAMRLSGSTDKWGTTSLSTTYQNWYADT